MSVIVSQITSLTIVYSSVYSGADQRKHQSSASLPFVRGIHRWPVNSPHKGPVTRKLFPFDDVIMLFHPVIATHMSDIYKDIIGSSDDLSVVHGLNWIMMTLSNALLALYERNPPVTGGKLMFFICAWTSVPANNQGAGNLKSNRAHDDVIVMWTWWLSSCSIHITFYIIEIFDKSLSLVPVVRFYTNTKNHKEINRLNLL